jgi:hypothetical protein
VSDQTGCPYFGFGFRKESALDRYFLVDLSQMIGETEMDGHFSFCLCQNPSSKTEIHFPFFFNPTTDLDSLLFFSVPACPMTMGFGRIGVIVRGYQERAKWAITSSSTSIGSVFRMDAAL